MGTRTKKKVLDTDKLEGVRPEPRRRKFGQRGVQKVVQVLEPLSNDEKARFRILDESLVTARLPVRFSHDGSRWAAWSPVFPEITIRHEDKWHVLENLRVALLQFIASCAKRPF